MKNYSYLSGKVLTVGGRVVSSSDLTKLDARSLSTAIKNKTIKEDVSRTETEQDSKNSTRKDPKKIEG